MKCREGGHVIRKDEGKLVRDMESKDQKMRGEESKPETM
jgi:hypothetical protein